MKKYFTVIVFIISSLIYSQNLFAKDQCNIDQQVNLNIFKKNDYKFYNYICESSEGLYLKGYLGDKDKKIFVDNYSDFAAKESPKLLAVSIYKTNKRKPPILITINSAYYCCTPQIEGKIYQVKLYQISENKILNLKNITNILGSNAEGFEGIAEGEVYYKYKTISEIKKWLDKNY
ncbi:hypothetical protein [Acinetobacter baumannii]|uniref:hypothetical protein n=2 Tax=Acinetobacter baumannii TaxID=470 RepID=UPI0002BC70A9|nr:hypothetical protein [Acinetobacter baumannii]EKV2133674.1 hypothetical protein [Acinetobacter baumannii]MCJ9253901.1 hypothetical protein [Acinetobacter baumannii]MCT6582942.1 hypothetical protein [Acinetobacter baumannii]MCT6586832.1 hypothetical protein [Acinetobacter baumannii]MCT6594819.1 hypothetical protein [Acinetobacter baumannii]